MSGASQSGRSRSYRSADAAVWPSRRHQLRLRRTCAFAPWPPHRQEPPMTAEIRPLLHRGLTRLTLALLASTALACEAGAAESEADAEGTVEGVVVNGTRDN